MNLFFVRSCEMIRTPLVITSLLSIGLSSHGQQQVGISLETGPEEYAPPVVENFQGNAFQVSNDSVQLVLEEYYVHPDTSILLGGKVTYRLYVECTTSPFFLYSLYGSGDSPSEILSSAEIFQFDMGSAVAWEINPAFYSFFPDMAYDSWISMGQQDQTEILIPGGASYTPFICPGGSTQDELELFESSGELNLSGGSIDGATSCITNTFYSTDLPEILPSFSDSNGRVLLAQITVDTSAVVYGFLNLSLIFASAVEWHDEQDFQLEFGNVSDSLIGCGDINACNFDENVLYEVAAPCVYASGCDWCSGEIDGTGFVVNGDVDDDSDCDADEVTGCTFSTACNYDALATYDDGSCELLDWIQSGNSLLGVDGDSSSSGDGSAFSRGVSISANGNVIAIGAPWSSIAGSNSGYAAVFEKSHIGEEWMLRGNKLFGDEIGAHFGWSVELSDDGNTLAVATPVGQSSYNGLIRVLEWDGTEWNQIGDDIVGGSNDNLGYGIDLSADGRTLIASAPQIEDGLNWNFWPQEGVGYAIVYHYDSPWNGGEWEVIGCGAFTGDDDFISIREPRDVTISGDSRTIAIQEVNVIRVYRWSDSVYGWVQIGADIGFWGDACSLNHDGNILAASNFSEISGDARAYAYSESSNNWEQLGQDISEGNYNDWFGCDIDLSGEGDVFVIGRSSLSNDLEENSGCYVYSWNGGNSTWELVTEYLTSYGTGRVVGMAKNGHSLIFGGEFINNSEGEALVLRNPAFAPNGDCVYEGCTNLLACNYDSLANVYDGTCLFPIQGFDCNGLCVDPSFGGPDVNCDSFVNVADLLSLLSYFGEEAGSNWDDNFPCLNPDTDCSGEVTVTDLLNILSFFGDEDSDGDGIMDSNDDCIGCAIGGCTITAACNYDPDATVDDGTCIFLCIGCTDYLACNYDASALQDDGSCIYPIDIHGINYVDCFGNCISDDDVDGICAENEIYGCTDESACNFMLSATEEDNSCEYLTCAGCLSPGACNFDEEATIEDDSCEFESCVGCTYIYACNFDPTAIISANENCEFGNCTGCTDENACNYNPTLSEDDNSCMYPDFELTSEVGCSSSYSDEYGNSISFSDDGKTVAIGAPNVCQGCVGYVQVFRIFEGAWEQLGDDLVGGSGHLFGRSVALSDNGNKLAVGAPGYGGPGNGKVEVFSWTGTCWNLVGDPITNSISSGYGPIGGAVDISGDGMVVAAGLPYQSSGSTSGRAKVYHFTNGNWWPDWNSLYGGSDYTGSSIALSGDGLTVVVGSPGRSGFNGPTPGAIDIFTYEEFQWVLQAQFDGDSNGDQFGSAISISHDGMVVAVGSPRSSINGYRSGMVRLFTKAENGSWEQMGDNLEGDSSEDEAGTSVSLSRDGTVLVIGSPLSDSSGNNSGHSSFFEWSGDDWNQSGAQILGYGNGSESGGSVAISGDGLKAGIRGAGDCTTTYSSSYISTVTLFEKEPCIEN